MSDIIINGSDEPQFNREEVRFGPCTGEYSMRVEGPVDKLRALIPQLIASRASGVFVCDRSPVATIDFSYGSLDPAIGYGATNEEPQTVWEYFATEVEKDIMEADNALTNAVLAIPSDTKILRDAINGTSPSTSQIASLSANGLTLYNDILAGVRSLRVPVPTLRSSKFVSYSYQVKASLTNVGKIISTENLIATESVPETILFNLPTYTTTRTDRAYGWYKKFPNVQTSGRGFTISQEWEYGLWSTHQYTTA